MNFLIDTIQKTHVGNLKLNFETNKLEQNISKKFLAITLNEMFTFAAKCSPLKVGDNDEMRKYSGYFLISNEPDCERVLTYFSIEKEIYDICNTFEICINQFENDIKIEIRDGKEYKYREKLYRQIYNLYSKIAEKFSCTITKVDETMKRVNNVVSKRELSTPDLETYRNKLLKLNDNISINSQIEEMELEDVKE